MRTPGDETIVLRRVEDDLARAERGNPVPERVIEVGGKHPGAAAKEIGIGRRNAAQFLARHRMAAEKRAAMQGALRLVDDCLLGASRIGYQRVGTDKRIELSKRFENARDRLREKQQIADAGRFFES